MADRGMFSVRYRRSPWSFRRSRHQEKCALNSEKEYPSHLLFKFCGSHSGEPELLKMAEEFVRSINSQESELTTKRPNSIYHPKRSVTPRRAKNGSGEIWLKIFSRYEGDECLIFPFRTAAKPRGSVTYNFKSMEAHRAMCTMINKLPPEGKSMALHRCGNGHLGCVTPRHLYWGCASQNNKDAARHVAEGKPDTRPVDIEAMRRPRHRRSAP